MASRQEYSRSSPEQTETARPRKRQKRSNAEIVLPETQLSRGGKACSICRKLKVKCDSAERGMGSCSRCVRLGLRCLSEKRSWTSADGDEWQTRLVIGKLERALEDVLEKLEMPALDLYVQPAIIRPAHPPIVSRQDSEERTENEREVSPGPMNSLIEATRLNGLRSQLRSVKQRKTGGMRRKESDLIAEKIITISEAEEMLELFKSKLSHHLFSAKIPQDATLERIRISSTVLFTAIILVTALHMPGKETLHEACHSRFLGLVSSAIFDRFHTLDDIRGLCIAAFWQADLTWKLSGLCIRMATELNLHHAFYEAFYVPETSEEERRECLEKARLWYLLYVLDHQSSTSYGRPPVMAELRPIKDYEVLLNSLWCTAADRALIAQVTGNVILSKASDLFGLEPKRTMSGDDASVLNHMRFTEDVHAWKDKWVKLQELDTFTEEHLSRGVQLHHHFSNLVLNSLVLRGRPMDTIQDLPVSLRPMALKAVQAAHSILQHFIDEPGDREDIVGMPLYLYSMIAFAVVFLMKMSHRWHAIGITIDATSQTIPLVEAIIQLLRGYKAGANHMVFSMANGFERMLRQWRRNHPVDAQRPSPATQWPSNGIDDQQNSVAMGTNGGLYTNGMQSNADYSLDAQNFDSQGISNGNERYQIPAGYSTWAPQDEELWTVGMGYDLLEPGGQGMTNTDFSFQMY
ncbi:hypothetical protein EG329_011772 [Mollisiaceae sp. DMI_Dod_QoI]|nr:hypothetical protein EG329_011772 [Helotiales sp. DMI_Dod_QoI]